MRGEGDRERGYALLAAVAGLAAFGYIAFAMLAAERGGLAVSSAIQARARLAAATDAGLVMAAVHVAARDGAARWHIDSRPYVTRFDGIDLTIRIEDERGKIRLDRLDESQVTLMFESAGARGRQLDRLRDSYLDWTDDDDEARLFGAESADYSRQGIVPRNGPVQSVSELFRISGMTRQIYDRIAPAATVFFGNSGGFSVPTAQPLALAVITGVGMGAPQVIARQRELAGQRAALGPDASGSIAARALTVRVLAQDGSGGRLERSTIIEFPEGPSGHWVIRMRL